MRIHMSSVLFSQHGVKRRNTSLDGFEQPLELKKNDLPRETKTRWRGNGEHQAIWFLILDLEN